MRRMWTVLGVAVAVLAAGCSSGGSNGANRSSGGGASLASVIADSSSKTQDAGSARMSLDVSISGVQTASGTVSFAEHGDGAFDFANKQGQFTLTIPRLGNVQLTILYTGDALYERLPASIGGALTGAKPWLKVDLSASAGLTSLNPALSSSSDPSQALKFLLGASNDVKKIGTDTVRGTSTTHYRLTLDLSKAAAKLSSAQARTFRQALSQFGSTTVPADVWVDGQGRLRRISLQLSVTPRTGTAAGQTVHLSETIEFYDFGTSVNVTPPPASQVTDMTATVRHYMSGSGSSGASPSP